MPVKGILSRIVLASIAALMIGGIMPSIVAPALYISQMAASPRLGEEIRLDPSPESDSGDHYHPVVAHNPVHGEYLVVWTNEWPGYQRDIYARRVSESGELLTWFCITTGSKMRDMPAVAYNAANGEYLVVWQHMVSADVTEIWGRLIAWDGSYLEPEFQIFSMTDRTSYSPRVAWNSIRNEYLVIWYGFVPITYTDLNIASKRVMADGSMPYGHTIVTSAGSPYNADLVYNASLDGYMVVWENGDDRVIYGAYLDHAGTKITPPGEFAIHSSPNEQEAPTIATDGQENYMVIWEEYNWSHSPGGDWDVHGKVLKVGWQPGYRGIRPCQHNSSGGFPCDCGKWSFPAVLNRLVAVCWHQLLHHRSSTAQHRREPDGSNRSTQRAWLVLLATSCVKRCFRLFHRL